MSSTGIPPQTTLEVYNAVVAANNNIGLFDPLAASDGTLPKSVCMAVANATQDKLCFYSYRVCDAGAGFAV
jgi:hypothetical protein